MFLLDSIIMNLVDAVFRDTVKPVEGSIVYCGLFLDTVEHSGIYIGNNEIVHMNGSGRIEVVTPTNFLARLGGLNFAQTIYVSCKGLKPVGMAHVAENARKKVGVQFKYDLVLNNCHKFTSGCVTSDFDNSNTCFSFLLDVAKPHIGADGWRAWETNVDGSYKTEIIDSALVRELDARFRAEGYNTVVNLPGRTQRGYFNYDRYHVKGDLLFSEARFIYLQATELEVDGRVFTPLYEKVEITLEQKTNQGRISKLSVYDLSEKKFIDHKFEPGTGPVFA